MSAPGAGHAREASQSPSRIDAEAAWQASDLAIQQWSTPVDSATISELDRIAVWLAKNPDIQPESVTPEQFDCRATARTMASVRAALSGGSGFVVLSDLPFDHWDNTAARAISWLLCHSVAPPVMQKWTGTRVYEVRDTGAKLEHGVRRSVTNLKQDLHTDGGCRPRPITWRLRACDRPLPAG